MLSPDFQLHLTGDGSRTLYSEQLQESYHSLNGAVQESMHVFINAGFNQLNKPLIRIFEVGFGTGLNALLTWMEAIKSGREVLYTAIEAFPISLDIASQLQYEMEEHQLFLRLHEAEWGVPVLLTEGFTLCKLKGDFTSIPIPKGLDLIYFDAFSPDKQPEMWEESLFQQLYDAMDSPGILVTYCAKGEVRRRLQRCGFQVDRIPGPPGKREMLRAVKQAL